MSCLNGLGLSGVGDRFDIRVVLVKLGVERVYLRLGDYVIHHWPPTILVPSIL